ncbi:MAG: hypothetical protein N3G21_05310 [Candidatus Hydrogenedentes bacterium]|nr:hypothetical protein [Candidatus Hydrogenedentota bacterium]
MGSKLATKCSQNAKEKKNNIIKAELYLRAILPTLSDLVKVDTKAKSIIENRKISILLNLRNVTKTLLKVDNGKIISITNPNECGNIHLYFISPEHALGVFEQGKLPILLRGFTKISFLRNEFDALSKRLEYFLKPTENLSLDERKISVALQFKSALRMGEVLGETDEVCQTILKNTTPGILKISIDEIGFEAYFGNINGKWKYIECPDKGQAVSSTLSFKNLETAEAMLTNKLDTFSALGLGNIQIWGLVPIIDNVGLVLSRINYFIS